MYSIQDYAKQNAIATRMTVLHKIQELENPLLSKHEQLVNGIINAINERIITQGAMLPSVNVMVKELGFARKTIVKAYTELKERGIVESKKRLGYFVANEATQQTVKVALLIYAFHTFQEIFYNTFREAVGPNIQVDVYFHHNNLTIYETILNKIKGQYGMYVVAPIHDSKTRELLSNIPPERLLLVDRYENIGPDYSYIAQEFEASTYRILTELLSDLRRFDRMILFFKEDADYPKGTKKAFQRFVQEHGLEGHMESRYRPGSLQRGTVYLTIGDIDLWNILKDCKKHDWSLGEDIGILSSNDSPVKEIINGGITTYFADFEVMASKAADFVLTRGGIREILPVQLRRRQSL